MSMIPYVLDEFLAPRRRDMELFPRRGFFSDYPRSFFGDMDRTLAEMNREMENLKESSGMKHHLESFSQMMDQFEKGYINKDGDFNVALNVDGFKPEEISVDYKDKFLTMKGEHKEVSPDGHSYVSKSFHRQYLIPNSVDDEKMKSLLTADGKLKITAPAKAKEAVKPKEDTVLQIKRA